jgi:hypothetical protein
MDRYALFYVDLEETRESKVLADVCGACLTAPECDEMIREESRLHHRRRLVNRARGARWNRVIAGSREGGHRR